MTDADESVRVGKSWENKAWENSEEAELLGAIADQQVLGLLVMVEHHLVGFSADARLLVSAERRMCGISVITVGPDAARLYCAAEAVEPVGITAPDTRAEAIERVVGNRKRFVVVLEGGHRNHRPKDLLLEDAHLVVSLEHGRLDIIAAGKIARQQITGAAGQDLCTLLPADVDVGKDLLELLARRLRADHGGGIQRVTLDDRLDALERALHEPVVDRFMDQRPAWTGADLALVEGEHHEAFDRLVEEVIILGDDILEEDVGGFAAEFERHRNEVLTGVLHDQPARCRLAGEGDLRDAWRGGERLAGLKAEAVDNVEHAWRQKIPDQIDPDHDGSGRLLGRFQHHAISRSYRRSQLPAGHQQREVPRNDLAHDTERLVEMISDSVVVDLGKAALLTADGAGEVAEMIDRERQVGRRGLADRLAVVPGLGECKKIEILLHAVGDLVENDRALGNAGATPSILGGMRGVERGFNILLVRTRDLAKHLAVYRREILEVPAGARLGPFAADEVAVTLLEGSFRVA